MSAIKRISDALGYDAAETALASGASLASVYALAIAQIDVGAESKDFSPASYRATELATARPQKAA